jgi:hypothetical protein
MVSFGSTTAKRGVADGCLLEIRRFVTAITLKYGIFPAFVGGSQDSHVQKLQELQEASPLRCFLHFVHFLHWERKASWG